MEAFIAASPMLKWIFIEEPHFSALAAFVIVAIAAIAKKTGHKTDKIWERLNKVELEQADQSRRMNTHAEHFDVVRADTDQAKEQAHKALSLCFNLVKAFKDKS